MMAECWLGSELQIAGPKKDETSNPCLLRTVMVSCLSLWYRTYHPKYSGLMSTYVLKTAFRKERDYVLSQYPQGLALKQTLSSISVHSLEHYVVGPSSQWIY